MWKIVKNDDGTVDLVNEEFDKVGFKGISHQRATSLIKQFSLSEEGEGPTLMRLALTNEPHVKLRNHPIEILENDIRFPIIVSGKYKHPRAPKGVLDLSDKVLSQIVFNHYRRVQDAGVYVRPGHISGAAWAWLSPEHGGSVALESVDGKMVLFGYGTPTDPSYQEKLERGEYKYTSADLHLNYSSNVVENSEADFININEKEPDMDLSEILARLEKLEEGTQAVASVADKVADLSKQLEKAPPKDDDDKKTVSPEIKQLQEQLEEQNKVIAEQQKLSLQSQRDAAIERFASAYKMASTGAEIVPAYFLEAAKDFLSGKEFELGDNTYSLSANAESTHEMFLTVARFLTGLIENAPRISGKSKSEPATDRPETSEKIDFEEIDEQIKKYALWSSKPSSNGGS